MLTLHGHLGNPKPTELHTTSPSLNSIILVRCAQTRQGSTRTRGNRTLLRQ